MPSAPPAYWICQAAGWAATVAVNLAFTAAYAGLTPAIVAIYVWAGIAGIALSHGWRSVIARRGWLGRAARTPWERLLAGVFALGVLQTFTVALAFAVLRPPGSFNGWGWVPQATGFWTATFLIWTALYASVSALRRANRLESETLRLQVQSKDAELRALHAQVNPHFFFNSLNSVRALIYENPDAAARMVDQLAGLMRHTLQSGASATVDLAREIAAVEAYLAIEKIRFEERLRPAIALEAGLERVQIPPMALQTLVENAVKYGVERSPAGSGVRITAQRDGSSVRIEVANEGALAESGGSLRVGIENTRKRLALVIGPAARFDLRARDGWVVATLHLPGP